MTRNQICTANEIRNTGPLWNRWPADLPQVQYITADGAQLCVTCANGGNGSRASDSNLDPQCQEDRQWRVIGASTVTVGRVVCAHCERDIVPSGGGK
jgi:hypothetical protein